jgi:transcription elongation factor Elf1
VGQGKTKGNGKSLPPYLKMLKRTKKKHRVSNKEFEELIQVVGGLKSFHQEKPSSTDDTCKKCIENFQTAFETNTIAINDFYDFTDEYFTAKNKIKKQNASYLVKYNKTYSKLTAGMNKSIREKLNLKLKAKPLSIKKSISKVFSGFKKGLGEISYSLEEYEDNLSEIKDYVNETYASYYSTNSLYTGSTPYQYCYGKKPYCSPPYGYAECSFIDIKASSNSDVVVIIKKNNRVYSHAYIKAGGYYKFKVGNGSFQTFFYYGKGWNPNKYIKNGSCGKITGGFVSNESLDKSDVLRLNNSSMSYTLYSVENGNFKPKVSNKNEAF